MSLFLHNRSFIQVLIASIMCGYSKEDWSELASRAEVRIILSIAVFLAI